MADNDNNDKIDQIIPELLAKSLKIVNGGAIDIDMERQSALRIEIDKNDFTLSVNNNKIVFDAVFIGMHGTPGEDGKLQGYFDTLGIPYTSCDAATSAITFNKRYTVAVASFSGIHVAKSILLIKDRFGSPD